MDFTFTPEQQMLTDSLSRLLGQHYAFDQRRKIVASPEGRSTRVWNELRDMGLLALPLPESLGGLGGSIVDVVAIGELMGRHIVVEPWLTSAAVAAAVVAATDPARAGALLDGSALAALAHEEGAGTADPATIATRIDAAGRLTGEKALVIAGDAASVFIVSAKGADGAPALYLVDGAAEGLTRQSFTTIDGRRAAHLRFASVAVTPVAGDPAAVLREVLATALIGFSAEAVGAMGALLETTATYASTRKQFGVPIASFQVIAHRLADMKLAYVKARSLLLHTAALAEAGVASARELSLLKAQVGRLGRQLGESAVQIHGGVGMTDELSVGHYLKRILFVDALLGGADYHLQRIGAGV
ncbi:MAG: acyl-CoA dehydrogenase family protein [Proteobacteria bacterium]|nr:acyl-CoA dehydrogenase family protein [Pseudomonadota bacterium]